MSDPVRFPANLPYDKWPAVSAIFNMMIAGNWAAMPAFFDANRQDITDSIGAGNYWRDKFQPGGTPVPTDPTHVGSEPLPWFNSPSGQVNVTVSDKDGRASSSDASGGADDWISTDPTFPLIEGTTSRGAGSSGFVDVKTGQPFYFKQESGSDKDMRASVA